MATLGSSGHFSSTLSAITQIKLEALSKKRAAFTAQVASLPLSAAASSSSSLTDVKAAEERARKLLGAAGKYNGLDRQQQRRVRQGLELARNDHSISAATINAFGDEMARAFEHEERRFAYADLFAKLLQEWLAAEGADGSEGAVTAEVELTAKKEEKEAREEEGTNAAAGRSSPEFEKVGRKEMYEQRAKFEEYVFSEPNTDSAAVKAYLTELFNEEEGKLALDELRKRMKSECEKSGQPLKEGDVKRTIKSLIRANLLSNEKHATLREFASNRVVLKEIADVLNMQLEALAEWSWPAEGVPIDMRRQLNGKYRVYMDEDLLDALLLQHIGTKWAEIFKDAFYTFQGSPAWKSDIAEPLSKEEAERRQYFLDEKSNTNLRTIEKARAREQRERYFMNQLGSALKDGSVYGDDHNESDSDDDDCGNDSTTNKKKQPQQNLKQNLLHLVATENLLNVQVHGSNTIVQSDFEWFGPSLSHASILATLEFFGVNKRWLNFFEAFLRAPLRFVADGSAAEVRTRTRGVPISHALSDALGEVLLFPMDYAVNKKADGLFLYRIHDDFWWWSRQPTQCTDAWMAMKEFASAVGLSFNMEKTGAVAINTPLLPSLPVGRVRWGFLTLSPDDGGRFAIDQAAVDLHIAELRLQLAACRSVFSWVLAYNKYMRFFANNFGRRAVSCLGTRHMDEVASTLERIHGELFSKHDGSPIAYLGDEIRSRFNVEYTIPGGWFYWPTRLGGLELRNPFTALSGFRELYPRRRINDDPYSELARDAELFDHDPARDFKGRMCNDEIEYRRLVRQWPDAAAADTKDAALAARYANQPFMPLKEYLRGRETRSNKWYQLYQNCVGGFSRNGLVEGPPQVVTAVSALTVYEPLGADSADWDELDDYWQFILSIWGPEMVNTWGGLEVVREGTLPVGMVSVWRNMRVTWEQ